VAPHPYTVDDAWLYAFVLHADVTRLDRLFDRFFREPTGGAVAVRAAGPLAVLTVSRLGSVRPAPPFDTLGHSPETEFAVWIPGFHDDRLVWFHPYLFVDQHLALAAGREIYGFRKQFGKIQIEGSGSTPSVMTLKVFALPRFAPDQEAAEHDLIEVRRHHVLSGLLPGPWRTIADGLAGVAGAVSELAAPLLGRIAGAFVEGGTPLMFLKQFRDVAQPDRACYQSVVQSRTRTVRFHGAGWLGPHTVTVNDLAMEPLREELGLREGPMHTLAAIWLHNDFVVEAGTEVWNARR
jgi:hypothetical protein